LHMRLAGVLASRVEVIAEGWWGPRACPRARSPSSTQSSVSIRIRGRSTNRESLYARIWLDGIVFKRGRGGEFKDVAVLKAVRPQGD
jgi:hypothetical protein